jgi:hypothetical protein
MCIQLEQGDPIRQNCTQDEVFYAHVWMTNARHRFDSILEVEDAQI